MNREANAPLMDAASLGFGILSTSVMGILPLIDASKIEPEQRRIVPAATAALSSQKAHSREDACCYGVPHRR